MKIILWTISFAIFIGGLIASGIFAKPLFFWGAMLFLTFSYHCIERLNLFRLPPKSFTVSLRRFWISFVLFSLMLVGAIILVIVNFMTAFSVGRTSLFVLGSLLLIASQKFFVYSDEHAPHNVSYFEILFFEIPYRLWKRGQTTTHDSRMKDERICFESQHRKKRE